MLEVEVKYRTADWTAIREKLAEWGAVADAPREDADHYFNATDRDFRTTDEALRLRRIGDQNFFTYKGPKRDTATKTRPEVELPLAIGPGTASTAVRFLTSLGYKPVAVVTKGRQIYRFRRDGFEFEACFDDVGVVGKFVELEIRAEERDYEAEKTALLSAAAALGLNEQERRSYLQMLLGS
jgi:adenylate cyclase, class 2